MPAAPPLEWTGRWMVQLAYRIGLQSSFGSLGPMSLSPLPVPVGMTFSAITGSLL
jgi:hypothetical protein